MKPSTLGSSKKELHNLLENKNLRQIPILVVGNKIDLSNHIMEKELIQGVYYIKLEKRFKFRLHNNQLMGGDLHKRIERHKYYEYS